MQIGRRWQEGAAPPQELPAQLRDAIMAAETARRRDGLPLTSWTLTFLEGAPVAELPDGTRLTASAPREFWENDDESDDELFPGA